AQPRADMRAEPVFDVARLADARGSDGVAQSAKLLDLETDRIDRAFAHQRHDLVYGAGAFVGLDHDRHRARDQRKPLAIAPRYRLLDQIEPALRHPVDGGDGVLGRIALVGVD